MLSKKNLQIVLVALLFSSMLSFLVLPSVLNLSVIDQEQVVTEVGGASITTGDILIGFGLFASTISVAIWLSNYRGRKK